MGFRGAIALVLGLTVVCGACGASSSDGTVSACNPGETKSCSCPDGRAGTLYCIDPSVGFGACQCPEPVSPFSTAAPTPEAPPRAPLCGDGQCNGQETCQTCPRDCGRCPQCPSAPSCTDVLSVPAHPEARMDLSQPKEASDAGTPPKPAETCLDPHLRIRIERMQAHKGGGKAYCIISASDGATSEVAITAKTRALDDSESHYFEVESALFWGQKQPHSTVNNLLVTYNCYRVKGDSWSKVLDAMGKSASQVGQVAGPYGWAFGVGSVAADAAAAAARAAEGDELIFNAQQVIERQGLTDLANGRFWTIRRTKKGGFFGGGWDWEIFIQAWGCADAKVQPR